MFFWSSQKKEIPEKNSAYEIDFVKWKEIKMLKIPKPPVII